MRGVQIKLTPEEKKFSRRLWWTVFIILLAGGLAIRYLPVQVLGAMFLIVIVTVAAIAISAGVRRGNGG